MACKRVIKIFERVIRDLSTGNRLLYRMSQPYTYAVPKLGSRCLQAKWKARRKKVNNYVIFNARTCDSM